MRINPAPIQDPLYIGEQRKPYSNAWVMWFQEAYKRLAGSFDYIRFNTTTTETISTSQGTTSWDNTNQCLNIRMNDEVNLSVGEEEYFPLVTNQTAAVIPDGTLVGFGGIDGGVEIVPYIADGSFAPWYVAGVTTQSIGVGGTGRITKFGYIRNLNTTGSSVSETWAAGDILYASPTVAGGFTKVQPTPPDLVIPVAVVRTVSSTDGLLLVRVLPQSRLYYGVFSNNTTQSATVANTIYTFSFTTEDVSSGIVIDNTYSSRIVTENSGLYDFQFSAQLRSSNSSPVDVFIWPRLNGSDITNSCKQWTIKSNTEVFVLAWNFSVAMDSNDYFEIAWATSDTGITMQASAAQTSPYNRPAIPSVILTASQLNQ